MELETLVDLSAGTAAAIDRLKTFKRSVTGKEPDARIALQILGTVEDQVNEMQAILRETPQMKVLFANNGEMQIDRRTGEVID